MHVELIGCTSSGKSLLAQRIQKTGQARALEVLKDDDFVLQKYGLNWLRSKFARTVAIDVCSLSICMLSLRKHGTFCAFTVRHALKLPVGWFERLNIVRNVFKKIGTYEIIRRRASDVQMIVVDEGTLHTAHYLFVHVKVEPDKAALTKFMRTVPLPDIAVLIQENENVLIGRTQQRGHKRISQPSRENIERFVHRAIQTFSKLRQAPGLQNRFIVVGDDGSVQMNEDCRNDPAFARVAMLVRGVLKTAKCCGEDVQHEFASENRVRSDDDVHNVSNSQSKVGPSSG